VCVCVCVCVYVGYSVPQDSIVWEWGWVFHQRKSGAVTRWREDGWFRETQRGIHYSHQENIHSTYSFQKKQQDIWSSLENFSAKMIKVSMLRNVHLRLSWNCHMRLISQESVWPKLYYHTSNSLITYSLSIHFRFSMVLDCRVWSASSVKRELSLVF
jgi:hypothetical protein